VRDNNPKVAERPASEQLRSHSAKHNQTEETAIEIEIAAAVANRPSCQGVTDNHVRQADE